MRDDEWLPKNQQCTLKEALYLAALKNVSVLTYARIYRLFPGEEAEFRALCPLGEIIADQIAAAGTLLLGQAAESIPAVIVRGATASGNPRRRRGGECQRLRQRGRSARRAVRR